MTGEEAAREWQSGAAEMMRQRRTAAVERARAVGEAATALADACQHELANRRFLSTLRDYLPGQVGAALDLLREDSTLADGVALTEDAERVLAVLQDLIDQRRDARWIPALGDADRLAEACYAPIIGFAQELRLPLRSNRPVTYFGDFDLSIWTGFIATAVAPLFLPPAFFRELAWWPAIGHEIGHDFLASLVGLDAGLRRELELPSEEEGRRIIRVDPDGIDIGEVRRIFGAWFEEIFCDLFGAMLLGPAYLASMIRLFAQPARPHSAVTVDYEGPARGYGVHPPRHLRFLIVAKIVERAGMAPLLDGLRDEWLDDHSLDGAAPEILLVPTTAGRLTLPLQPFERIADELVERLYLGPLAILGGRGLRDVAGLDYGPARHEQVSAAHVDLLADKVPRARDVRAVIAAAVLARREAPERSESFMRLARAAIPAVGTHERGAATLGGRQLGRGAAILSPEVLRDAMVLGAIMTPPPSSRRTG